MVNRSISATSLAFCSLIGPSFYRECKKLNLKNNKKNSLKSARKFSIASQAKEDNNITSEIKDNLLTENGNNPKDAVELMKWMEDYKRKELIKDGELVIRALKQEDITEVTNILVECFSEPLGYYNLFKWWFRKSVTDYVQDCLFMPPRGIVLVAVLKPNEEFERDYESKPGTKFQKFLNFNYVEDNDESYNVQKSSNSKIFKSFRNDLDSSSKTINKYDIKETKNEILNNKEEVEIKIKKENEIIIGTVEVSLELSSRSYYWLLNPPSDAAYLCNMGVKEEFRRKGHASRLLKSVEEVLSKTKIKDIYLHLKFYDENAGALYRKFGFVEEDSTNFMLGLLGIERKYLMKKKI